MVWGTHTLPVNSWISTIAYHKFGGLYCIQHVHSCHSIATQAYGAAVQVWMTKRCSLLLLMSRAVLGWRKHHLWLRLHLRLCYSLPFHWMLQHNTEPQQLVVTCCHCCIQLQ